MAFEVDVNRFHAVLETKSTASGDSVGFLPPELIVVVKNIKEGYHPNVGFAKMSKNTQKSDGVGVKVQKRKAVEVQNQKEEFGWRRQKTATNKVFNNDHPT